MKDKYNIEEIKEKLDRCKNMKLKGAILDVADEIGSIKIDRRKTNDDKF